MRDLGERLPESVARDMEARFGLRCGRAEPVSGGWLNRKWRVEADGRALLVKQYSSARFPGERLAPIEASLIRQSALFERGVPCPHVWTHMGQAIYRPDGGEAYMIMDFAPGRVETCETVTAEQTRSLGDACGRMHKAFAKMRAQAAKGYPLCDAQTVASAREHISALLERGFLGAPEGLREAALAADGPLRGLSPDFLRRAPRGLAHEDFSNDNILFDDRGVTAIVDFDRGQYGYLWHDAARATLSLALRDGRMDVGKARAFQEGYARHMPFSFTDWPDALRLAFCIEAPWWIRPESFATTEPKVRRFLAEMLWLAKNWDALEGMFAQ